MELKQLKALLGIPPDDVSQDAALTFIMDNVIETVCNYCRLETVPKGLANTCYRMAIDLFRAIGAGKAASPLIVSSVSEGGTSTSFTSAISLLQGNLLTDYKTQLNRYRKLG